MDLIQHPRFSKFRKAQRDEYIGSSLVSPRVVSEKLATWSGSNNRDRLTAMKFHKEWRHESCAMMQWYSRQQASSTTIKSIQHRRSTQGPFYHEFLVLKLTDGAVCRVERMGDGSRADAIRYTGCMSHDLIQWFQADRTGSATSESEVLTEVSFSRDFDVLDVLAVCYTVQNVRPCSVYTLQRYNCYFLCLTVLAVISRRAAAWEGGLTREIWDSSVAVVVDQLSGLKPDEANEHVLLRLCAILDPGTTTPGICVLRTLENLLRTDSESLVKYKRAIGDILWYTSWDQTLLDILQEELQSLPNVLEGDTSQCANELRALVSMSHDDAARIIVQDKRLLRSHMSICQKELETDAVPLIEDYDARRRMKRIEQPISVWTRFRGYMLSTGFTLGVVLSPSLLGEDETNELDHYNLLAYSRLSFTKLRTLVSILMIDRLESSNIQNGMIDEAEQVVLNSSSALSTVSIAINELTSDGVVDVRALRLILATRIGKNGLVSLAKTLVAPGLARNLYTAIGSPKRPLHINPTIGNHDGEDDQHIGVAEFQQSYIKERIRAHAKRVAQHRLAAEPLVCQDIERTMEYVWKSLPVGFGGVAGDD